MTVKPLYNMGLNRCMLFVECLEGKIKNTEEFGGFGIFDIFHLCWLVTVVLNYLGLDSLILLFIYYTKFILIKDF